MTLWQLELQPFLDPIGVSVAAHTCIIIMLKRSLVLITMQIPLLFFHLINIIRQAYFLWVHKYADMSFICFSTALVQCNLTLKIVTGKHSIAWNFLIISWSVYVKVHFLHLHFPDNFNKTAFPVDVWVKCGRGRRMCPACLFYTFCDISGASQHNIFQSFSNNWGSWGLVLKV